ncbi:alpha/beta fold hydrolase [Niveispirillum sp.]|uniref:alpha/beta hydrolase n=1 Tax=Niveispirillum sp. TaxID=1917217 RepID=UPI0025D7C2FC|nr:alpha/beta fold hydrolase [Niveispirillum sp.]
MADMTNDHSIYLPGTGVGGQRLGLLLIHGLGGTPVEMKPLARKARDAGADVLCCRLPGHCGTADELACTPWQDWYAEVEAGLARLARDCGRVVVGGLSMGALLAARLAALRPDQVQGLIMLAPTLRHDGWSIPWYGFLLRVLIHTPIGPRLSFVERPPYGIKDERIRAAVVRAMHSGNSAAAGLLSTPSGAIREMWRLTDDVNRHLAQVRQPALLVHARHDDIADLSNTLHLQRRLAGRVEALVLEDSYHLVTVDGQRDLVAARVNGFLSALAADTTPLPLRAKVANGD